MITKIASRMDELFDSLNYDMERDEYIRTRYEIDQIADEALDKYAPRVLGVAGGGLIGTVGALEPAAKKLTKARNALIGATVGGAVGAGIGKMMGASAKRDTRENVVRDRYGLNYDDILNKLELQKKYGNLYNDFDLEFDYQHNVPYTTPKDQEDALRRIEQNQDFDRTLRLLENR